MFSSLRVMKQWVRDTFAPTHRPIRNPKTRLNLENLEAREVMDASSLLVQLQGALANANLGTLTNQLTATSLPGVYSLSGDEAYLAKIAQQLRNLSGVSMVEMDHVVQVALAPNDPGYTGGSLWGIDRINAPAGWNSTTGSTRIGVAINDTGVDYTHQDLYLNIWINQDEIPTAVKNAIQANPNWDVDGDGLITFWDLNDARNQGAGKITDLDGDGRITGADILKTSAQGGWSNGADNDANGYTDDLIGWDWVNNDNNPMDDHSHGTHIAGTIGAIGNNGIGVAGVNWRVQMAALKFMDSSGYGTTSRAAAAVRYAADEGIEVSNNSWGGSSYSGSLASAISYAATKNHIFVAAAGNDGLNLEVSADYPAWYSYDNIIVVASTGGSDGKSGFSNYGVTKVDIGAPGESIYSTMPGGGYGYKSGTSMATPHVAGAVALIWAQNQSWSYAQVRDHLYNTSRDVSALSGLVATGGIVDLGAALVSGPQISVSQSGSLLLDGGSFSFGTTSAGTPVTKTFTIQNVGTQTLTINSVVVPAGYTLVSGPASSVAVGGSTTFQVRLNATVSGNYNGTISVHSNDPDGSFDIAVTGQVASQPPTLAQPADVTMPTTQDTITIVLSGSDPDGDPLTYSATVASEAYQLDQQHGFFSNGNLDYNWGGRQEKWWQGSGNAWFFILPSGEVYRWDGSSQATGTLITTLEPHYYADPSLVFNATPGAVVSLSGNVLTVNPVAGFIGKLFVTASASDGVLSSTKTFKVTVTAGGVVSAPEIQVLDGTTDIADGTGVVGFGSTTVGAGITKTFTVKNLGNADLSLGAISLPSGFSLVSGFGATTLQAGQSTTFQVRLTASAAGTYGGQISFTNNDGDESPFNFSVSGTVVAAAAPEIQVLDGTTDIADGTGAVGFGSTTVGTPVTRTFTVKNTGNADLSLGAISLPSGFTLVSGFGATTLQAGQSTTFQVRLTASAAGTYGGQISFTNNDGDESPFNFSVSGTVTAPVVVNQPPLLTQPADQSMPTTQDTLSVPLVASDPNGDPLTYSVTVQTEAQKLDQQYGFYSDGNQYYNWGGRSEKWWQGAGGTWYFILPTGQVHAWDGSSQATGTLIASLDTAYYADPSLLYNATAASSVVATVSGNVVTINPSAGFVGKLFVTATVSDGSLSDSKTFTVNVTAGSTTGNLAPVLAQPADVTMPTTQPTTSVALVASDPNGDPISYSVTVQSEAQKLDQQYGFYTDGNQWYNWGGRQEKWFLGSGGQWYFILASGEVYRWDGSGQATGALVFTIETAYYADPSKLFNAGAVATASVSGGTLTVDPASGFVGKLFVTVTASDGSLSDSKTFKVTVTA